MLDNITKLWEHPLERINYFFGKTPYHKMDRNQIHPYQLGTYLSLWGEIYGCEKYPRVIGASGRGTGKSTIFQELCPADMAAFMPYFLQTIYLDKKPIPITIVFVANVKKNSKERLQNVKQLIASHPILEKELVDYKQWTKDRVVLKNGTILQAEGASDRARGIHGRHKHSKVIYLLDEFAFWGGSACMAGQEFVEEIAEQSLGAVVGAFTTPYGKRGGAWWAWNHPNWHKFTFPTWINPVFDKKRLALKVKNLLEMGRQVVVDQEIRGRFVDDAGLFFTIEIWSKSINHGLEWEFDKPDNFRSVLEQLMSRAEMGERKKGYYLLGCDPNSGSKTAGMDPYGISLIEKIGKKYYSRLCVAYNGKSLEDIDKLLKLICLVYEPQRINFDGGGGYHSGPMAMLKGAKGVRNMVDIPESRQSIVGYMSLLRSMMAMGLFEQPPSETLRESQMSMTAIGDKEVEDTNIKFQTTGKQTGLPCDLAALGLAVAKENIGRRSISAGTAVEARKEDSGMEEIKKTILLRRSIESLGGVDLRSIYTRTTGTGI